MTSKNILVAEDSKNSKLLVIEILKLLNCSYKIAVNGQEVLNFLENESFDLILMDVHMPFMDGITTTRIIRNDYPAPYNQIPIIAITGKDDDSFACHFEEYGFNDYIKKPYSIEELELKLKGPFSDKLA